MRNYRLYLGDIVAGIESIEEFIAGMDFEDFERDDKTASAVMRKLEIIGEAVKQVPEEIRQAYPQVPWKEMAGMRLWSRLFPGLESDYGESAGSQVGTSENTPKCGLTPATADSRLRCLLGNPVVLPSMALIGEGFRVHYAFVQAVKTYGLQLLRSKILHVLLQCSMAISDDTMWLKSHH